MAPVAAARHRPAACTTPLAALLLVTLLVATPVVASGALVLPLETADTVDDELPIDTTQRLFAFKEEDVVLDSADFLANVLTAVPDTVPADVQCEKMKYCDRKKVCAVVCKRGSVVVNAWLEHALALQRRLSFRRNFCRAQLPGTHNSAINLADGYGVEDHVFEGYLKYLSWFKKGMHVHTNDQLFSLTDQLRMGVRFLELDVHWFDNDLRIAHCGGFSSKFLDSLVSVLNKIAKMLGSDIQWDSGTIGCKPSLSSIPADEQRSLKDALQEVAAWVHAPEHAREFLMIFFDDESSLMRWKKVTTLLTYLKQYFTRDEMLVPADLEDGTAWPTFEELINKGKRIVFMSGTDYLIEGQELLFVKDSICNWTEPRLPMNPFPSCDFSKPALSPADTNLTLFRPETSEIEYGFLNADGQVGKNKYLLTEKTLPDVVNCGANIPSPDNITPKRMEATIWTLEQNHTLDKHKCVGLLRQSSKWQGVDCNRVGMVPACVLTHNTNVWRLGAHAVKEQDAAKACSAVSLEYSVPATGYENQIVFNLLKQAPASVEGVWLDARDLIAEIFFGGDDVQQVDNEDEGQVSIDAVQAVE